MAKLKVELPCDPVTPLLDIYPKELKSGSQKNISPPIFIQNSQGTETLMSPLTD